MCTDGTLSCGGGCGEAILKLLESIIFRGCTKHALGRVVKVLQQNQL